MLKVEYKQKQELLYPSCCNKCVEGYLWNPIDIEGCDSTIIEQAKLADYYSTECAKLQWAFNTICKDNNWKMNPQPE